MFLLLGESQTDKPAYRPAETMQLSIACQNIADQPTLRSDIRYYLSQDAILDWNDQLLGTKTLGPILANAQLTIQESLPIPQNLIPNTYFIITVCSTEGAILNSKISITQIQIR